MEMKQKGYEDMPVPKYYEFQAPMLRFLSDGQSRKIKEVREAMKAYFNLSDDDVAELLPSKQQTYFANRVGWASTYLSKAGLIDKPRRGEVVITEEGKKALENLPEVVDSQWLSRYSSFREFVGEDETEQNTAGKTVAEEETGVSQPVEKIDDSTETPDDAFENAFQKIHRELQDALMEEVMRISPKAFEQMVLDLMAKMGYGTFENAGRTTAATGDEGIDGIIMEDKLGFDLIYIQAKKWGKDHVVGRPEVQAFVGAIAGKGGQGLFVTTSSFSRQAKEYAEKQHIILMDGEKLTNYMIEYNFGVRTRKVFEIKAVDTDVFNEYEE